jgi:hypothetical protein
MTVFRAAGKAALRKGNASFKYHCCAITIRYENELKVHT